MVERVRQDRLVDAAVVLAVRLSVPSRPSCPTATGPERGRLKIAVRNRASASSSSPESDATPAFRLARRRSWRRQTATSVLSSRSLRIDRDVEVAVCRDVAAEHAAGVERHRKLSPSRSMAISPRRHPLSAGSEGERCSGCLRESGSFGLTRCGRRCLGHAVPLEDLSPSSAGDRAGRVVCVGPRPTIGVLRPGRIACTSSTGRGGAARCFRRSTATCRRCRGTCRRSSPMIWSAFASTCRSALPASRPRPPPSRSRGGNLLATGVDGEPFRHRRSLGRAVSGREERSASGGSDCGVGATA